MFDVRYQSTHFDEYNRTKKIVIYFFGDKIECCYKIDGLTFFSA